MADYFPCLWLGGNAAEGDPDGNPYDANGYIRFRNFKTSLTMGSTVSFRGVGDVVLGYFIHYMPDDLGYAGVEYSAGGLIEIVTPMVFSATHSQPVISDGMFSDSDGTAGSAVTSDKSITYDSEEVNRLKERFAVITGASYYGTGTIGGYIASVVDLLSTDVHLTVTHRSNISNVIKNTSELVTLDTFGDETDTAYSTMGIDVASTITRSSY